MSLGKEPMLGCNTGGIYQYPPRSSSKTRTETTVLEEEHYDADGKLTGKSKTTTTRTWTEEDPGYNPWVVTY